MASTVTVIKARIASMLAAASGLSDVKHIFQGVAVKMSPAQAPAIEVALEDESLIETLTGNFRKKLYRFVLIISVFEYDQPTTAENQTIAGYLKIEELGQAVTDIFEDEVNLRLQGLTLDFGSVYHAEIEEGIEVGSARRGERDNNIYNFALVPLSVYTLERAARAEISGNGLLAYSNLVSLWQANSHIYGTVGDIVDYNLDPVTYEGAPIEEARNLSIFQYSATQLTLTAKPTWRQAGIGGAPAMQFDGGDYLDAPANVAGYFGGLDTPFTVFVVFNQTSGAGTQTLFFARNSVNATPRTAVFLSGGNLMYFRVDTSGATGGGTLPAGPVVVGVDYLATIHFDGNIVTIRLNGATMAQAARNVNTLGVLDLFHIGRVPEAGAALVGYIGHLSIFAEAKETSEYESIEAEIAADFGIVLP